MPDPTQSTQSSEPTEPTGAPAPPPVRGRSALAVGLMLLATVGVGIPAAIALTPGQGTTVAGQYVAVGAGTPALGWLGEPGDPGPVGPAQIQQVGGTTLALDRVEVRGPLRPRLELGPLVRTREADRLLHPDDGAAARQRAVDAVVDASTRWYVLASLLLLAVTLALLAVATTARTWLVLGRATRHHAHLTVAQAWRGRPRRLSRDALLALLGTAVAWAGVSWAAYADTTAGLSGVRSLRDLVGTAPLQLEPAGPPVEGYVGAVLGDSRASRLGGPLVEDPDADDRTCGRSQDSLAVQLTRLDPQRPVLNLACPSATIDQGLLGEQLLDGTALRPQVARLLQLTDLELVVVMVGPNDLAWSDFLRYCYGVEECDDVFTSGQFDYRLAAFDRAYGDLLASLADLPEEPEVVVVGSYDVFADDAAGSGCAAVEGPEGVPGLDEDGLALLAERTERFNDVLVTGAAAYGFTTTVPALTPLCARPDPLLGPDLQGLDDPAPFHPTAIGMVRLGAAVHAAVGRAWVR